MKKLLLLGGSRQQILAIEMAKKMGCYTILCDYLPDNPGQYVADKFYLVSTTDKEAVLQVAREEKIDGVLAYASDPAAPTAAYVAENLGLPTNPYKSVATLCDKGEFRRFLKDNDFCAPLYGVYNSPEAAREDMNKFKLPVIVKPVDSSGSKGVNILHSWSLHDVAIEAAFSFSRSKTIIVEEFVENKYPFIVGGDIFVINGKIELWGLLHCFRNKQVNITVPAGKIYPIKVHPYDLESIKFTLQKIINKLNIKNGEMNIEVIIDKNSKIYPIDIGPRSGGNLIPEYLEIIFNINLIELSIKIALGDKDINYNFLESKQPHFLYYLHSNKDGIFKNIIFSNEVENFIIKKRLYKKAGDKVYKFTDASRALGIIFMRFENEILQKNILTNIDKHIIIELA